MPTYTSQYPPVQNGTYVKATTQYDTRNFNPWFVTDPTKSLIGSWAGTSWIAANLVETNQRFHIDLGAEKTIARIYYENLHTTGTNRESGVKNFTFWGSNTAAAFADLTYATDTNWTQLTTAQSTLDIHVALNQADPKYMLVTGAAAYRYYAFKFADIWNPASFNLMGIRRIELQTEDSTGLSPAILRRLRGD